VVFSAVSSAKGHSSTRRRTSAAATRGENGRDGHSLVAEIHSFPIRFHPPLTLASILERTNMEH